MKKTKNITRFTTIGMTQVGKSSNRRFTLTKVTLELIVSLLIILWIYTGLNKLISYEDTKFQMARSPFIHQMSGILSILIPAIELLIATLLIFKKTRMIGLFASLFMMLMFTGYIYAMLNYSYYVPCSCGGVLAALSWKAHLIFNIAYSILAFIGIILENYLKGDTT